ncbi:MAG: class GN sortase [Spongiibacteraceae bacterium]
MKKMWKPSWKLFNLSLLCVAGILMSDGLWVYAKAELAQLLIERAWQQTLDKQASVKPWPWADTWPVARLQLDHYGVDLYVLNGIVGSTLAFGPGAIMGQDWRVDSPEFIAGHRDTHFKFMRDLKINDTLTLGNVFGVKTNYRVVELSIVDSRQAELSPALSGSELTLITCYPFDAIMAGGPLRYVVKTESLDHNNNRLHSWSL